MQSHRDAGSGTVLKSQAHLKVFAAALALGGLLLAFPKAQLAVLAGLAALAMLPVLVVALYVVAGARPPGDDAAASPPARLGSPPGLAICAVLAVCLFLLWPDLDIGIARSLYSGANRFAGQTALGGLGRWLGYTLPFLVLAWCVFAAFRRRGAGNIVTVLKQPDVLFLSLGMALGPGLIVNLGMKDHLHRPRPAHIAEFGGGREFRPFYRFDGACPKNCSFPSGEAAEAFWMLAPASLAPLPWRGPAIAGAVVFGGAVGLLRMAFGGHFLSDVVFAGLIMWGLLMALRWLIYAGGFAAVSRRFDRLRKP